MNPMPDALESLSDGELSEVFAVEVMRAWRESPTSKTIWYRGKPVKLKFATSADAVMPWLEKAGIFTSEFNLGSSAYKVQIWKDYPGSGPESSCPEPPHIDVAHEGEAKTFAKAACIALIRSARATQQDCGVRE